MGKLRKNVTVHAQAEDGSHQTFRFRKGEEVPAHLAKHISNPDVWDDPTSGEDDLIGGEDPLMKRTHVDLVMGAEQWGVEGVSANNKKAELVAAIRAAGYEGDGYSLLDGE